MLPYIWYFRARNLVVSDALADGLAERNKMMKTHESSSAAAQSERAPLRRGPLVPLTNMDGAGLTSPPPSKVPTAQRRALTATSPHATERARISDRLRA